MKNEKLGLKMSFAFDKRDVNSTEWPFTAWFPLIFDQLSINVYRIQIIHSFFSSPSKEVNFFFGMLEVFYASPMILC